MNNQEEVNTADHELRKGADLVAVLSDGGWRSKLPVHQFPICQKLLDQYMTQLCHYQNIQVRTLGSLEKDAQ